MRSAPPGDRARSPVQGSLGRTVLVPVVNPDKAAGLVGLAATIAAADGGTVVPFTVVDPRGPVQQLDDAWELVGGAAEVVAARDVASKAHVELHPSVAAAVLEGVEDEGASLVVIGWEGVSTRQNVFDSLVDEILGSSAVPLVVARLRDGAVGRVLLAVSDDDLSPAGRGGLAIAQYIADRLRTQASVPLVVLRTGKGDREVPDEIIAAADEYRADHRREDLAVGDESRAGDIVVIPVAPTESGLRTASTRTAWAAPDVSLIVVIDTGHPRSP